jgi:hypothetical protein
LSLLESFTTRITEEMAKAAKIMKPSMGKMVFSHNMDDFKIKQPFRMQISGASQ